MKKIFLNVMVILSLSLAQNLSNLSTNSPENLTNLKTKLHQTKTNSKNQVFALMKYDKNLLENGSLDGYVMSEKLDGVRALWDGAALKSRSGKSIAAPRCFTQNLPPFALDGELFIARGRFEELLSVINSANAGCEAWQSVSYQVFDAPNATGTLMQRLETPKSYLNARKKARKDTYPLIIIEQKPIYSQKELDKALQEVIKLGGEGLVVRKNAAPYEPFRTRNAMKLKAYDDSECKVIAHHEGKGKFAHKLGSITCEQAFADYPQTRRFKIGSGFTDKERDNPPPINSIITYKFNGYTKKGLPKFPVFLRLYHEQ